MKRFAVSFLTAICGLLLTSTAHASFAERHIREDPGWKTQEEADADFEARNSNTVQEEDTEEEEQTESPLLEENDDFDQTDSGEATFGAKLVEINLPMSAQITRAEFTALFVRSLYTPADINNCYWDITSVFPPRFELLFRDVSVDNPYAPEICIAMRDGLVRGYGNDIFKPDAPITMADAAKILARAHGLTPWVDSSKPKHWFDPYIQALSNQNAIPMTVTRIDERISVADAREMIERLQMNDRNRPSRSATTLIADWERLYEPRRVAVAPRPPVTSSTTTKSTSSKASTTTTTPKSASTTSVRSAATASEGTASSRPKAWYEF